MTGLKILRTEFGLTTEEMAEMLHVSKQIVNYWELGKKSMSKMRKAQIAELFDVDKRLLDLPLSNRNPESADRRTFDPAMMNVRLRDNYLEERKNQKAMEEAVHDTFKEDPDTPIYRQIDHIRAVNDIYACIVDIITLIRAKRDKTDYYRVKQALAALRDSME